MTDITAPNEPKPCITFSITIGAQEMRVRYRPDYFASAGYGYFEFTSPHESRRRIPISETGYRSHFAPMWEIRAAPSVEEYAEALALALMHRKPEPDDDAEDGDGAPKQFALF